MRYHHRLLLGIGIYLVAAANAAPQSPSPSAPAGQPPPVTFQAEVNYVDIDATVTDQQGNFVKDLTKDDFEVREDGKLQKIEMFSYVAIPVEPQASFSFGNRPISSDVTSNRDAFGGRLYVIVLDDQDTSFQRSAFVKKSARQFVEQHLGANDVAAVVYTSGRADASQEFTSNQPLLLASIDKFIGSKLRSATLEKADEYAQQQAMSSGSGSGTTQSPSSVASGVSGYGNPTTDPDDMERGSRARGVLESLKNLAEVLGSVRGRRKALVLFSEGIDYPINDIFTARDATEVMTATADAISAAARSNVSFFTIDPRGLVGMSPDDIERSSLPDDQNDPGLGLGTLALMDEMRLSQDSLRALADQTGGFASVNSNDMTGAFDRIVRANSMYYVLGYYPPDLKRDGKFHKIEVRTKRPGLMVSSRKGYAAPRGKTPAEKAKDDQERVLRDSKNSSGPQISAELRAALNSPLQQSGLTLAVQAAPFKTATREASIALAVEIDGGRLHFEPRNGNTVFADKVELSFFAVNDRAKALQSTNNEANLMLRPATYERVKAFGLRMNPRITLPPGRYQVRVGARESGAGELGSVFYDLDVPDFTSDPLAMSGLLLTSTAAQLVPTAQPDPRVGTALPGPATSRREFVQGDTLSLFAEVYDNISSQQVHQVDIATRLLAEDGREVFASRETLGSGTTQARSSSFEYARSIPLKDVPPGRYLLRIEAQVRGNVKNAKPAARETLLTVRSETAK